MKNKKSLFFIYFFLSVMSIFILITIKFNISKYILKNVKQEFSVSLFFLNVIFLNVILYVPYVYITVHFVVSQFTLRQLCNGKF